MRVDWVSLVNFRSYSDIEWKPDPGVNLLIGPNGAGKTNILEAIAYLSTLKSFRSAPDRALIRDDQERAVVRAAISSPERERLVEIEIPAAGQRRTQVDKTRLKRTADLLGVVRAAAFLPEDLDLVKRGPAQRRDLLDEVAVQLWPAAYLDQAEFDRSLRQRNAFFKQGFRDEDALAVWDNKFAQTAGRVLSRRSRVIEEIEPLLAEAYAEIAGSAATVSMSYSPTWGDALVVESAGAIADRVAIALESVRSVDYERRMTTVGPHRDEPGFLIDGHDARLHGSQGEQRTTALAARLAAHRAVTASIGEPPILILDDVFSELDPRRAGALANALTTETQTLITSARPEDVPISGQVWSVGEGRVA